MIDGIYHVRFSSSNQMVGEGLAFIENETVNGGDHGYLYLGKIASAPGGLAGRLQIKRWNPSVVSVFGAIPSFDLELAGSQNPSNRSFQVSGSIPGHPNQRISIAGSYISELART